MAVFKHDIIPDEEEKNPIVLPKSARNATVPHIFNSQRDSTGKLIGYQRIRQDHQEFPKVLYRPATEKEIQERQDDLTEETWLEREFDLVKETGVNQLKKHSAYVAWMKRPVEKIVDSPEELEALGGKWFADPACKLAVKVKAVA
jgi:hypothetical protein